jgi:hypothetical protein
MASILDHLMARLAAAHAQRVYGKFSAATARAAEVQSRVLLAKIRRNADSDFGRHLGFHQIRSVADFRRRVPIMGYEDHQPWIERVKGGDTRAMFGGRQRVRMFALTSGTAAEPKYIPVTDHFLAEYKAGWNAWGIKALLDHPAAILRGIAQVSSRMDESRTTCGIACGAITGIIAATQKRLVRKYYVTPGFLAEIDDPAAKYYTIMRLSIPRDVAFVTTASPATQLKLARTGVEHAESIIRDVRDGTLRADLAVPTAVREQLKPRLRPDAATARRLEALLREHGRLLPRHYWNLTFLANWMGGTMGLYLRDFPEYFGDVPMRDVGLLASEGRVSIPVEDGTPSGVLEVTGQFFEFVPADRREEASPPTFLCHELEAGQEYFLLLTTSSGLYRYDLGDLVRVTGYLGQAPIIEFLNKGNHTCSLAGEKLTEHQVILAMQQASQAVGPRVPSFVLAPRWGHPPHYLLHVEASGATHGAALGKLAEALEGRLCDINVEYAQKRHTDRLGAVAVNVLPAGTLHALDSQLAGLHRKSNEQYKHKYLYCRPGEDDELLNQCQ